MKAESRSQKAEVSVVVVCAFWLFACGQSSVPVVRPAPPPAPAPVAAAASEPLPSTIAEAESLLRNGRADLYERGLRALGESSDPLVRRRALALLGLYAFDQKRWDDALRFLSDASDANPPIAPFLRLRLIDVEVARGNIANAATIAQDIINSSPHSSAATQARLELPALLVQAPPSVAPPTSAALPPPLDLAFADAMQVPIDSLTADEFVRLADSLEQLGRPDLSAAIRMRLLTDFRGGRYAETTYRQVASLSPSPLDALSFDQALTLATDFAGADRYDQALDLFERIAQRFPEQTNGDAYKTARWRALFNSRHYDQLLDETKSEKLTAPLLLLRARAAWREDRSELFLASLRQLDKRFPKSPEAVQAKLLRAKYYTTDETDHVRSIDNLRAAIDAGAIGNDGENLWTLGWTYMLAGRDADALAALDRYVATYPDADYTMNALFWSGKILDRLGRRDEADAKFQALIAQYPFNYFSYRAREIRPSLAMIPAASAVVPFPDLDAQLAAVADTRLAAVDELDAIGLTRDASREMKRVAAACPDNLGIAFKLADVYVRSGEPAAANATLQRQFRDFIRHGGAEIPLRFWQILYPLSYWDDIRAEAAKRNLDPYLVASIIRQESGFEPSVVSNAGAVGLMQIMPPEADRIATRAGIEGVTRAKLFDPVTNIAVGTAEYSQKLEATGGNPVLAVAAYNAGEEAVGKWLAHTPLDDVDLFVEAIPYAETRLYVKCVTRNRFEYRRIYEGSRSIVSQRSQ